MPIQIYKQRSIHSTESYNREPEVVSEIPQGTTDPELAQNIAELLGRIDLTLLDNDPELPEAA